MATLKAENPYIPGTGTKPPHLAGRSEEKGEIEAAIARIKDKPDKYGSLDGVSPPLILIGPRGVGKTTLLDWAERKARQHGVQCVALSEKLLGGPEAHLGDAVMGKKDYAKATSEKTTTHGLGNTATTVYGASKQTRYPAAVLSLSSILDRQLKKGPLLVMLDEAHAVAPGLLREFCVDIQEFVRRRRPLALVMAGTPGLEGHLDDISATFMKRAEFMQLNLLSEEEAREALSVPAAETGVPIEEDALEKLVEWTDCYPYFIQQAGRFAWETAKGRGASAMTLDDAKEALGEAGKKRRRFYKRRYLELVKRNIVSYALQAIELIEGQADKEIGYMELIVGIQDANEGMEYERAADIQQSLMNLGFIYDNGENYEAGIPSLFDYVREKGSALLKKAK